MFMRENGGTDANMVMAFAVIPQAMCTTESGMKAKNTEEERSLGKMETVTKGIGSKISNMGKECMSTNQEIVMMENGTLIKSMVEEFSHGNKLAISTMESGNQTRDTEEEYSSGAVEVDMREDGQIMCSTEKGCTKLPMEENSLGITTLASSNVKKKLVVGRLILEKGAENVEVVVQWR